jgi:hypothetical protein
MTTKNKTTKKNKMTHGRPEGPPTYFTQSNCHGSSDRVTVSVPLRNIA